MANVCKECQNIDGSGGLILMPAIGYCKGCGTEVPYRNIRYCDQCVEELKLCRICFKELT